MRTLLAILFVFFSLGIYAQADSCDFSGIKLKKLKKINRIYHYYQIAECSKIINGRTDTATLNAYEKLSTACKYLYLDSKKEDVKQELLAYIGYAEYQSGSFITAELYFKKCLMQYTKQNDSPYFPFKLELVSIANSLPFNTYYYYLKSLLINSKPCLAKKYLDKLEDKLDTVLYQEILVESNDKCLDKE